MKIRRIAAFSIALLISLIMGGCATVRQIDSQVQTQSTLKSTPVAGYRFERLPSQQTPDQLNNQLALEAMAEKALALVGLKHDEVKPGYSVLIGASLLREVNTAWMDPWRDPGLFSVNVGFGRGGRRGIHSGVYSGFYYGPGYPRYSSPYLRREVTVVLRDLSTGQVVYETHAVHDSPWTDSENILPLMFQAALSGFPTPPSERRLVNIALPPAPAPTPTSAPAPATNVPGAMAVPDPQSTTAL